MGDVGNISLDSCINRNYIICEIYYGYESLRHQEEKGELQWVYEHDYCCQGEYGCRGSYHWYGRVVEREAQQERENSAGEENRERSFRLYFFF